MAESGARRAGRREAGALSAFELSGLMALVTAAPLLVGGAPPAAQVGLAVAAFGVTLACLFERRTLHIRPLTIVYAFAVAATVIQLVPMPLGLLRFLSPQAAALYTEVGATGWHPVTIDVAATVLAAVRAFLLLGVFVVSSVVARSTRRARAVVFVVIMGSFLVAVAALVQKIFDIKKVLGVYEFRNWPGSGIWGSFVDGNHAASYFTFGVILTLGAIAQNVGWRRLVLVFLAVFLSAMTLYTRSRGGAVGLFIATMCFVVILSVRRYGPMRGAALAIFVVTLLAIVAGLLSRGLFERMSPANLAELWDNQKTRGWIAGIRTALNFPLLGAGRGTFELAASAYRSDDEGVRLVYAENFVVQRFAELGFVMTLVLFALVIMTVVRLSRYLPRMSPMAIAATSAVVGLWFHELFDFGTELPGVAVPGALLAGIAVGQLVDHAPELVQPVPRIVSVMVMAGWALVLAFAPWAVRHASDREFERVAAEAKENPALSRGLIDEVRRRHPGDGYLELVAAQRALRAHDENPTPHLNRAMRLLPSESQAHWLLARVLVAEKRQWQAALEYRLAIERRMIPPYSEMARSLGPYIADAVPQSGEALDRLARELVTRNRPDLVVAVVDRYLDVEQNSETSIMHAITLLQVIRHTERLHALTVNLLDVQPSAAGYLFAARAAASLGDGALVRRALRDGRLRHPTDVAMTLDGSQLLMNLGALPEAHALLREFPSGASTLEQRLQRENLLADLATRLGASDEASQARLRARQLERQLHPDQRPDQRPD